MSINIGDKKYFEQTFKDYYNPLVNYINKKANNLDASKEIVQNVFSKLWSRRDSIKIKTSIKSYLYQSVNNCFYDYVKAQAAYRGNVDIDELDHIAEDNEAELNPYIIRSQIEQALSTLKEKNQKIFRLNKFEGLTYKEIANHLEISERAVEDNIARAMKSLKTLLKDKNIL